MYQSVGDMHSSMWCYFLSAAGAWGLGILVIGEPCLQKINSIGCVRCLIFTIRWRQIAIYFSNVGQEGEHPPSVQPSIHLLLLARVNMGRVILNLAMQCVSVSILQQSQSSSSQGDVNSLFRPVLQCLWRLSCFFPVMPKILFLVFSSLCYFWAH